MLDIVPSEGQNFNTRCWARCHDMLVRHQLCCISLWSVIFSSVIFWRFYWRIISRGLCSKKLVFPEGRYFQKIYFSDGYFNYANIFSKRFGKYICWRIFGSNISEKNICFKYIFSLEEDSRMANIFLQRILGIYF